MRREGRRAGLLPFRRGAADCVRAGHRHDEVLPLVVLEQVTRSRKQRQRAAREQRIEELERYNESIIANMNSALVVVDSSGTIRSANPMAEAIFDRPPGGLEGEALWRGFEGLGDIASADGEGADARSLVGRTLEDGVRFRGAESVITLADGTRIPIGLSCSPLMDAAGQQLGAIVIFQDLSEIKQLQRRVLQTEKLASIGQLAAGVAHEINNPMGFIHANLFQMSEYLDDLQQVWERVDRLQKAVDGGDAEEVRRVSDDLSSFSGEIDLAFVRADFRKALRESQEGAERIRHIVQDLRDFSHRDDGDRVPSDLNQCLDSTANIVWTMMKHSVVLTKEYADLPRIPCYPMQLKQVFMNLLVNAYQSIEARPQEAAELGEIVIRTALEGDEVVIEIRDTGVGIPGANLSKIFDPFFTTKEVGAGTGLGLSTSYNIVRRHEGRFEVESEEGVGTTFSIRLPRGNAAPRSDV